MLTPRPRSNERKPDAHRVTVYLPNNDYRKLKELSHHLNMTASEMIRELVRREWGRAAKEWADSAAGRWHEPLT
jgi:hypothetical protein